MIRLRKLKNIICFILIVLIILSIYILIYKNIDVLVPKYEDVGYSFAIKEKEQDTEFLNQLADYINTYDYYRKISDEDIIKIKSNEKLDKLLKYFYCSGADEDYFLDSALVGTMYDTIYGDLNILIQRYNYYYTEKKKSSSNLYMIAYSDDMNKIFYLNNTLSMNNSSISESKTQIYDAEVENSEEEAGKQEELTMTTITQHAREKFFIAIPNMEFNPSTIMYDNPYYILEDSQNDITIYYDSYSSEIYGMYIGFKNK